MAPDHIKPLARPVQGRPKPKSTGFKVGPAHAAKDAYLGKVCRMLYYTAQKIKSDLIAHAKIKRTYAKTLKSEGLHSARLSREAAEDRLVREAGRHGKGKGKRVDNRRFGANVSGANEVGREGGMRVFGAPRDHEADAAGDAMDVDRSDGTQRMEKGGSAKSSPRKSDAAAGPSSIPSSSTRSWNDRAADPSSSSSSITRSASAKSQGKQPMTAAWGAMADRPRLSGGDGAEEGEGQETLRELKRRAYGYKPKAVPKGTEDEEDPGQMTKKGSFLKRSKSAGSASTPSLSRPASTSSTTSTSTHLRRTITSSDGQVRGVLGGRHALERKTSSSAGKDRDAGQPRLGKRMGVLLEQIKRGRT